MFFPTALVEWCAFAMSKVKTMANRAGVDDYTVIAKAASMLQGS